MTVLIILIGTLLALAAIVALGYWYLLRRPLPRINGTVHLQGLHGPVEIIRDRWGVPHIYAQNRHDLFFAQGYVHAQDRLWQMELNRRLASGRLSEIFGRVALEADRFLRVFGLRRAAEAEVDTYGDDLRDILEAYTAGVNAFIASHRDRLPIEFKLLGIQPEPWIPQDCIAWAKMMAWGLGVNWEAQVLRMRFLEKLGPKKAAELEPAYPADDTIVVPKPTTRSKGPTPPIVETREAILEAYKYLANVLHAFPTAGPDEKPSIFPITGAGDSNSWVISGAKSSTGKPLLANDPHMALQIPSIWYQIHLIGDEMNVIGVSMPGEPCIVIGHNDRIAWGMTTSFIDVQDLYLERLHPEDPTRYEFQGKWEQAQVVREEIRIKGESEPVIEEVIITRHGPIITPVIPGETRPLALRWVALEPSQLLRSVWMYNRARNWEEFREALRFWSAPAHNFIYADVEGNIGYQMAGDTPVRRKGYGLVPVPGWTGEYEWEGYIPYEDLPYVYNPPEGYLVTANQQIVGRNYPYFLTTEWEPSFRAHRLVDQLRAQDRLSLEDFKRMQFDSYSLPAERLCAHLRTLTSDDSRIARALQYLKSWDFRLTRDSVAATIHEVLQWRLMQRLFEPVLGDLTDYYIGKSLCVLNESGAYFRVPVMKLLEILEEAESPWYKSSGTGEPLSRDEFILAALREAVEILTEVAGADMTRWTWGRLHRVLIAHPLGRMKPLNLLFNRGPYPMEGGNDCPLRAYAIPGFPFESPHVVASFRQIVDLGDFNRSLIVGTTGQSGHPASRHYSDMTELWLNGEYYPMLWDRARIEAECEGRLKLMPV